MFKFLFAIILSINISEASIGSAKYKDQFNKIQSSIIKILSNDKIVKKINKINNELDDSFYYFIDHVTIPYRPKNDVAYINSILDGLDLALDNIKKYTKANSSRSVLNYLKSDIGKGIHFIKSEVSKSGIVNKAKSEIQKVMIKIKSDMSKLK